MDKLKELFTKERIRSFLYTNRKLIAVLLVFVIIGLTFTSIYFSKPEIFKPHEKAQVVIDAGHGGDDLGATFGGRNEKDDNLRLAHRVRDILVENGIDVALTRNKDYFVTLEDRCVFANRCDAEIFVSLHRNSAPNASGTEIWIHSSDPAPDRALATDILNGLDAAGLSNNRGVKCGYAQGEGNYYVNKHTEMTSCLVELGFITSEEDNLLYDENFEAYAQAIADAIMKNLEK